MTLRQLTVGTLAFLPTAGAGTAAARSPSRQQSDNWAGYAVTARTGLSAVSAVWKQPAARRDQPFPTYSAFWAGLGGFTHGSRALEQIGTEADCRAGGNPIPYALYEMVPAPSARLELSVHPGNPRFASVRVRGHRGELRLADVTTRRNVGEEVVTRPPDTSSADWIAEAPAGCASTKDCEVLPLADFGVVHFYHANATSLPGHTGTIADPAFSATMLTLDSAAPALGPRPVSLALPPGPPAAPGELLHVDRSGVARWGR